MKKTIVYVLLFIFVQVSFGQNVSSGSISATSEVEPPCLEVVTYTALRALRNAGNLNTDCKYIVENYSRGCLTADRITLTASDNSTLSLDVAIKTPYDNSSWSGIYDVDLHRVIELNDNIGNKITGRYGNEIDRFPWGQNSVWGNSLDEADVYIDCNTTAAINENDWESNSYTDLRGVQGTVEDNSFDSYSRVYLNNATTVDYRRNKHSSYSYVYMNSMNDILFRQNVFTASSYVRKFAGGRWTMYNSVLGRGDIRQYNGIVYNTDLNLSSGGRLYMRELGTTDVRNTTIRGLTYIDLQSTAGLTRIWRSDFTGLSYFYIRNAVTAGNRYFYSHNQSASTFDYRSGSANITLTNNNQASNGYIRWDNIAGTIRLYQNDIDSRAEHRLNGVTGTHSHYYNSISNYIGRINLVNCIGSSIQRNSLNEGRIDATGGNPTVLYNSLSSIGQIILTNYTGVIQRSHINSDAIARLTTSGNMTGCTLGTSFDLRSTGFTNSYVTVFGNITYTVTANNYNTTNIHNQINTLN